MKTVQNRHSLFAPTLALGLTLVMAGAALALPPPLQTYFIPLPETHTYSMFEEINSATTTNIVNVISIAANATNTIIVWDHFEDGYEADVANPTQATTRVWGDNNPVNGTPPGLASDVINAGAVIALRSTVGVPHNPANVIYDGQDKFTATKAVAATYAAWPLDPGAVLADAIEVTDTTSWGTNYISPVGTNVAVSSSFFQYSALSIMAAETGTVVRVDLNTNGVFELTNTLNAGGAWFISNGVVAGSQIVASKPVQVALLTGDVNSQYEARWFNLTPVRDWCYCGIVPVTTTEASDPLNVFLYNQYAHSITVDVSLVSGSTSFTVTPKSVYRYAVPAGSGPQMLIRGQNPTNPTLFYLAVGIMDASDPDSNNSDHDWGFTVPTLRTLSPQILVGWGPGADTNSPSWTGTENGSPVWVVARSNTTLYVDYDGNPATGPLTDPNGNKYNFSTNVLAFQSIRIYDPDRDQTGMRVYSVAGTPISAAWGQDPSVATAFNPYLDMGTTIPTLASFDGSKSYSAVAGDADGRIEPGETIQYTLTLVNGSFNAVRAITLLDPLPANVAYVPNSTTLNGAAVPDNGIGTPFPLDAPGYTNIPDLVSFSNVVVTFQVVLANPFPTNVSALANTGTFFTADGELIVEVDTPVVQADLELVKSVNNATPVVGSNVVFTVTVTNRGPHAAEEVVVSDPLPAGLNYVSHSGGAYVPGSGLWTIGDLAVGGSTNLLITATVTGGNPITNVAQVQAAGVFDPDSTPGNENGAPYEDDEDDAVVAPVPQIDLELQKSVNNGTPNVGGNVIFTIAVTNRGPSDATGVTVEDALPAGLAYVSDSGGGAYDGGTGLWTIGTLAVGGSTSLQITATVLISGNIENIAQVQTANETDPDSTPGNDDPLEDDQDDVDLTVPPAIDLELAKSVDDATPSVGDNVVYTLVLTNKGPNNATGVTVADVLPSGLSYVSHSGPGTYVPGTGLWTIGGPMIPGASRILQITATVAASGTRTNFAQVQTADQFDVDSQPGNAPPYAQDDDDIAVIAAAPAADLELTKSVDDATPNVGGSVVFTVVATNRGPDNATGVTVEDVLPAGLAYVSDDGGGAYVSGTGIWTIGALNVGASVSLQITAAVTNSGNIVNVAQIETSDQYDVDSTPGNDVPSEDDQDDAALTVPPAIDLELAKSVDDATPSVGDNIVYTVVLTNKGPNNATGVTVADALPAGLSYVGHAGPGTYVPGTGVWTIGGPMIPGASRILQITATVTASGTITNFAQVQTADQFDVDSQPGNAPPYAQDDDDFVAITVDPAADLELTKSVDHSTPNVGGSVVFTVVATNRGPDNATGVTVEDVLPAGLAYVSDDGGGAYDGGTGIWTIGALNVGASVSLQITAAVTNSGSINNIAQIETADQFDVDSTPGNDVPSEDDQDDASLQVPTAGDLELAKSVDDPTPNVGDSIVFTVVVTNRGPNAQQSVTVLDALPAGLSYASHAGGLYNPGTGIWSIGNLNANASTSLTITATVGASGAITNFAQVQTALHFDVDSTPGNASPYVEDDDDFVVINTPPAADLELRKDVDNGNPNLLDNVAFTVTVTNRGPDNATGVTVEDILPAGLAYMSDDGGGAYVSGTGIWTIGNLAVGGSVSLQVTAQVTASGLLENIAQIEAANEFDVDSTPGNDVPAEDDQDNALVSVGAAADLELTKSVDNPAPNVGGTVVYTLTVDNDGPDNATGVAVEDVLPAGLTYVSDDGGGAYDDATGIWTIGNLNVGNTATLQITADVVAAGTITNVAQVNLSDQYDPDSTPDNDDPQEDDQDDAVIRTPQADLELVKDVDDATPNVGDDVTFTVAVSNRGPDAATGVTVDDVLPAGLAYASDDGGGAYDDATGIWTIGNLAVDGLATLQITATVTNSGIIDNIAQVETADQYDPDSTPGNDNPQEDDQDNATLNVPPASDLELTKDVDNATPAAGEDVTYTVTVVNQGPDEGEGISVEDVLPAGVSYVSHANGLYNPGTGIWNVGDLAVGASTSLTLTVKVEVDGTFTNVAQIQTSDHFDVDSTPGNEDGAPYEDDEDEAVIAASPTIDLEVDKTVDKAEADPFEHVVWTVTVTNKGPSAATGVTVYDELPANWVHVSDSGGGAYDPGTHLWTIGSLPAGGSTSMAITAYATLGVTVMGHGPIPPGYTNVAQVWTANEPDVDSTPGNEDGAPYEDDEDDAFIPIRALSDLALTKTVDDPTPYVGSQIAYTIVVTNEGPQPAVGVRIEDVLPAGLTYVSNSVGIAYSSGSGIWDIGLMLSGWSRTLTIWATVDVPGLITNVAQVNHNEHFDLDSTPDNDDPGEDDQDEVVVDGQPLVDVELVKTVDKAEADPFEHVVWTIVVTNKGPSDATGLTVYDELPTNWVHVSDSGGGAYDPGTHLWTIGTLPAGGSTTLDITAYATLGVSVMGHGPIPPGYTNVAQIWTLNEDDADSIPGNEDGAPYEDDEDEAFIPIRALSDLALTKTVDNPTPFLGDSVVYTVTVTNEGPQPAVGVLIEDMLPAGLTYVSNSVGAAYSPGPGIWDIGLMLPGWSRTLSIWATVDVPGLITNVAQVNHNEHFDLDSTPDNDDPTEDDQDDAAIDAQPLGDVGIAKTLASPLGRAAAVGESVSFEIVVTNSAAVALSTVQLTDTYDPAYLAYVSALPAPDAAGGGTITWANLGPMDPGDSATLTINFTALASTKPGETTNRAVVVAVATNGLPLDPKTNEAPARVSSPGHALEKILLSPSDRPARVGESVLFEIRVTNTGDVELATVAVEDTYETAYLSYVSAIPASDDNADDGVINWADVGPLSAGASVSITATFTAVASTLDETRTNRVVSTPTTPPDEPPVPPQTNEVPYRIRQAGYSLEKELTTPTNRPAIVGEPVVFRITLVNTGEVELAEIPMDDTYETAYLSYVSSVPPSDDNVDDGAIHWTDVGPLPAGASTSIVATFTAVGTTEGLDRTNVVVVAPIPNENEPPLPPQTNDAPYQVDDVATIGDRVWDDLDGDGIQDVGEPGIPNVTVRLYGAATNLVATTLTDANGLYAFAELNPGTYFLRFVRPAGYQFTPNDHQHVLGDAVDSDAHPTTGATPPTELEAGETDLTWDAGFYRPAAVGDFVWLDEDWDGEQDAGEQGIPNVQLQLLNSNGTVVATTLTGINGFYLFSDLLLGKYTVKVNTATLAANLAANPTFDLDGTLNHQTTVTLGSGVANLAVDFGYNWTSSNSPAGSIGDRVWVDEDADGIQDPGEPGIPNVTVRLYVDGAGNGSYGTLSATTATAADGSYIFTGLAAGAYVVRIHVATLPTNYTQTGDPDTFGAALPAGTGDHQTTAPVVLAPGDVFVNADFGYWFPNGSAIGDLIYFDANANGAFNPASGDSGIASVTVVLLNAGGKVVASTITDANGNYLFPGLPAGTYTVWVNDAENVLNGLVQTGDPDGGLDSRSTVSVNGVSDNLLQDHGYTPDGHGPGLGLVGDFVFIDRNGNGSPSLEEGIQGVKVWLYDSTGTSQLATTFTDPDGHYYFGGLAAGSYMVRVATNTLPNGGVGLVNTVDPDTASPGNSQSLVTIAAGGINLLQDFGYVAVVPNAIGGTLWRDCNANGILDSDETPRWAGVQIILRNAAGQGIGSTYTDVNGMYRFDRLPDGIYSVDVNDVGNVLNGFWHSLGPNPGANNNSQPDPYVVAVSGGQTNGTGDFGYYVVVAELGDYVWYDINGNGLQDGGEPGLSGVKVTLKINYPNGNQIVMQTLTDSSGRYVFANLLLDERYNESTTGNPATVGLPRFQISIEVSQAILTSDGYEPTTINAGSGFNDSRNPSGIFAQLRKCGRPVVYDFGFRGGPLLAVIGNVEAFTRDGQTIVRWETIESWGTEGFWLDRLVGDEWVRISQEMLPFPLFGVAPIIYEEVDPEAVSGGTYVYRLVERENDGDILYYGPYTLTVDGPGRTYDDWAAEHFTAEELADPALSGRGADPDGDGLTNEQEFLAGTDPNDADSVLQITGVRRVEGGLALQWKSVPGRFYKIAVSDSLFGPFLPLEESILATAETEGATVEGDFSGRQMFFQVILVGGE